MATANIAQINPDGTGQFIYLHYGEPLEYGSILLEYYQTEEQVRELLALGDMSSIGMVIGNKVDFNARVYENALRPAQCLAYHRDRNDPWEHCQPRELTGGLEQFREENEYWNDWLYGHTPDGWAVCLPDTDARWASIPDAVLADAKVRLDSIREAIRAGQLEPAALERRIKYITAATDRPWQPPAPRQLLHEAATW